MSHGSLSQTSKTASKYWPQLNYLNWEWVFEFAKHKKKITHEFSEALCKLDWRTNINHGLCSFVVVVFQVFASDRQAKRTPLFIYLHCYVVQTTVNICITNHSVRLQRSLLASRINWAPTSILDFGPHSSKINTLLVSFYPGSSPKHH